MPTRYIATNCQQVHCPLTLTCSRVATEVNTDTMLHPEGAPLDFLLVGDSPSTSEFSLRVPFRGFEGNLIREILSSSAPDKSYAMAYVVRGISVDQATVPVYLQHNSLIGINSRTLEGIKQLPLSGLPEKDIIIRNCVSHLQQDIINLKPKKIIIMGNFVLNALFPREHRNISDLKGIQLEYNGYPVEVVPNAGVISKNPSARGEWETRFKQALRGYQDAMDTSLGNTVLVKTVEEAKMWIEKIKNCNDVVGIDTETRNLNKRYGNKLATLQIALDNESAIVFPFYHRESPFTQSEIDELIPEFYKLFAENSSIKLWVGHNIKFENHILRNTFGTTIKSAPVFDTMTGAFLLDENRLERAASFKYGVYSLKQLVYDYLNFDGYNKAILQTREDGGLVELALKDLAEYGALDAYITRRLYYALLREADRQGYSKQLKNLSYSLYNFMIDLFTEIEYNGFYVDLPHLRKLISRQSPLLTRIQEIEAELKTIPEVIKANNRLLNLNQDSAISGVPVIRPLGGVPWIFSFAKQNHPQTLFFDVMGMKPLKTGKSGRGSVDDDFQQANIHIPLITLFNEWVLMGKMMSSFATKLYDVLDPAGVNVDSNTDGKIRASFHISKIVTGRAASSDPNLQAIPRAENEAKKAIKNIFRAPKGHALIQFDYKANEMRWVGILAQDDQMARMFISGREAQREFRANPTPELKKRAELLGDIHRMNASKAFGVPIEQVTKDQRQKAKGLSFGVLYDSSHKSISELYKIDFDEVIRMFDNFYLEFDDIANWKVRMKQHAADYGFIETPTGRRRRFPIYDLYRDRVTGTFMKQSIMPEHRMAIAEAGRQASNAPVQGIASDAAYIGATLLLNYIREKGLKWEIVNAVHDSVVLVVPLKEIKEAVAQTEYYLTEAVMEYMSVSFGINFNLPIEVEAELGISWGDLDKWDGSQPHLEKLEKWLLDGCPKKEKT